MIDIHSHFFPALTRADAETAAPGEVPWLDVDAGGTTGMIRLGDRPFRPVHRALWDSDTRVRDLDAQGLAMQVVCATPVLFGYGWEAGRAIEWAARMNEAALAFCAAHPTRLKALAQVPLQDTEAACAEASRAMAAGCVGVQIGNHVGERDLDHPDLVDFLIHCAENDIPVLVHPWDMMGGAGRMKKWMLPWLVAMPAETQLSMLALILSGALTRIPESLKICFAHGGGSFAYTLGRVDNAWRHRDIVRQDCPELPSSYARRFFCDSAVFDERALRLLVDVMGSDRILFGTDQPFPLGEQDVGGLVRSASSLTPDEKNAIFSDNALRFFDLSSSPQRESFATPRHEVIR